MLCGMWDLPRPGFKLVSPALADRFLTTAPPGKPCLLILRNVSKLPSLLHLISDFCISKIILILVIVALNVFMLSFSSFFLIIVIIFNKLQNISSLKKKKCQDLWHILEVHSLRAVI